MRAAFWCAIPVAILCAAGAARSIKMAPAAVVESALQTLDSRISGTVRGTKGGPSVTGRVVEVVNVDTAERQRAVTNDAGSFSFHVRPGSYRVEVALVEGESIVRQPGVMRVNHSSADEHADIVIGSRKAVKRPVPIMHTDPGLGPPIV